LEHHLMIDSHRRALLTVLLAFGTLAAAPAKNIPATIKSSPTLSAADIQVVKDFVNLQFAQLADPAPEKVKEAREALIGESKAGKDISSDYLNKYADAIAKAASGGLKPAAPVRVKVGIAVVVGRVAEANGSTALAEAILLLLGENQPDYLKVWGLKGARGIMRELIKAKQHDPLLKRIVAVAKSSPNGVITEEAYDALTLDDKAGDIKAAQPALADALLDVVGARLTLYQDGKPGEPISDHKPWNWFSTSSVWKGLTPAQQVKAVETMCSLLTLGAKHIDDPKTPATARDQLVTTVTRTAGNMFGLFADPNPLDPLPALLKQINGLDARTQGWSGIVAPVCPMIQKVPQYKNMNPKGVSVVGAGQ
jgi:hypothetical protein